MAYDLDEQEKVEALKDWWKRNGNSVVWGLALAAAAAAGIQGWRYYQKTQLQQAAVIYEAVQESLQAKDTKKVREAAGQVMEKYPSTPYAARAALLAASANYQAGDAKSAKAQLQWTIDHAKEDAVRDEARLNLAGILLDEKNYAEALKLLETPISPAFAGLYADLRGDVLQGQGKVADARAAYKAALEKLDQKSGYRQLVQMKLDALGG
jgi:predicted negative regulator of RcsB-dependent stress response